jgi:putative acetyltransferase
MGNAQTNQIILNYRLASAKDLGDVYELYMNEASNPYLTYDHMDVQSFESIFKELLQTKTLYVAEHQSQIVASYRLIRKPHRQAGTVYIGGFVIKPAYQGKGMGRQVLENIREEAASMGIRRMELTVDLDNIAAINLYKKLGFEIEGLIRSSYKRSDSDDYYDEYLMGLIIQ